MTEQKKQEPRMATHVKVILGILLILPFAAIALNQWFLGRL